MNILLLFTILTIVNVVFSTIKSIATVKASPAVASLINGLYYGYYNAVLLVTMAEFPLWQKIVVTALCNFVGVYIVKWAENKARKDRLWKVEFTVPHDYLSAVDFDLTRVDIPHSYVDIEKYAIFNCYCRTQVESAVVRGIVEQYDAKYFVSESKNL